MEAIHRTTGAIIDERYLYNHSFYLELGEAVLHESIRDFFIVPFGRYKKRNEERKKESIEWINDNDLDHPLSFQNICEALGLDHNYFRERLYKIKDNPFGGRQLHSVYKILETKANPYNEIEKLLKDHYKKTGDKDFCIAVMDIMAVRKRINKSGRRRKRILERRD